MAYYPLRPELSESTYALYRATGSAKYLAMGEEMVHSLNAVARNANGFAVSVLSPRVRSIAPCVKMSSVSAPRRCPRCRASSL